MTCGPERDGLASVPPCNDCPDGTAIPDGWVCVPAGEFTMGSPATEVGRGDDEGPQRRVRITRPFLMMETEVTQAKWHDMYGTLPEGTEPCADCPVAWINWYEAADYANSMSSVVRALGADHIVSCYEMIGCEGDPGTGMPCDDVRTVAGCNGYRLPTEAEWEYAARAGTGTRFWSGDDAANLDDVAWYSGTADVTLEPVGRLRANRWGLYDVHGNAAEFVVDVYISPYPAAEPSPMLDPVVLAGAGCQGRVCRVVRGGHIWAEADGVRVADRAAQPPRERFPFVGMRLVQSLP